MEKRKPAYDLTAFRNSFDAVEKLNVTATAVRSAAVLGFGRTEIVATIQTMQRSHFFKSMTSFNDHPFGRMSTTFRPRRAPSTSSSRRMC
jgi:motility quorum-sensing regulator / GCU-specific mRNA interferase toxin